MRYIVFLIDAQDQARVILSLQINSFANHCRYPWLLYIPVHIQSLISCGSLLYKPEDWFQGSTAMNSRQLWIFPGNFFPSLFCIVCLNFYEIEFFLCCIIFFHIMNFLYFFFYLINFNLDRIRCLNWNGRSQNFSEGCDCLQCAYCRTGKDWEIMFFAEETGNPVQGIVLFLETQDSFHHLPLRMFMKEIAYFLKNKD